jgi:AraC-like DNA-binding protein
MQLETISQCRFDAAGIPPGKSLEFCASAVTAVLGDVSLEGDERALASTRGICCNVGQLRMMTCYFPRSTVVLHGKKEAASDRLLMVRSMEERLFVCQSGQMLNLEPGEFVFLSASLPFELRLAQGGRIDCGSMPAQYFPTTKQDLGRFLMRPIPKAHPPLKLLITHAAYLLMRGTHAPGEAEMIAAHFRQVLPMVVEYLHDDEQADRASASLSRIKAFIESRLTDPHFGLAAIAAKFGVTPRHVQKLFQHEATTFSRYVLERRLERARSLILQKADRPISSVAYDTGFGDLSYFNRVFRRRFGMTPSGMRNGLNMMPAVSEQQGGPAEPERKTDRIRSG